MEDNISVDLDFFDGSGRIDLEVPVHPITISRVGTHQGMPVMRVTGPRELVRSWLLHVYGADELTADEILADGTAV